MQWSMRTPYSWSTLAFIDKGEAFWGLTRYIDDVFFFVFFLGNQILIMRDSINLSLATINSGSSTSRGKG